MPVNKINSSVISEDAGVVKSKNVKVGTRVLWVILIILTIILVATLFNYRKVSKRLAHMSTVAGQQEVVKKEVQDLVNKVSKLILLPSNETPTVATIADAENLSKTQPFYKGSHNGDKVLIYFQAQKAYIYDPVKNLLVNVGPVYIENRAARTSTMANTEVPEIKLLDIEIRNGTEINGKAAQMNSKLKMNSNFNVTSVGSAVTTTYKDTVLVDLSNGKKANLVSSLEKELGINATTTMPLAEKATTADVLLIVGLK